MRIARCEITRSALPLVHTEREVKLGADADFQLHDLSATWEGVAATPWPGEQLSTV
jgi:hypothetical protein